MDSRLWKLLLGPGGGIGKLVAGVMGLAMKAMSTILGSQMLSDAAAFVQSLDSTFGVPREGRPHLRIAQAPRHQFVVVSAAEPDTARGDLLRRPALRRRHAAGGLILNRTHPMLSSLAVERAIDGAEELESSANGDALTAGVLRIHADRGQTAKREVRLLSRFTGANPRAGGGGAVVAVRRVRSGRPAGDRRSDHPATSS